MSKNEGYPVNQVSDSVDGEAVRKAVRALAGAYHEDWRNKNQKNEDGRLNPDGIYIPRVKVKLQEPTGKTKWINEGGSVPEGYSEVSRQDIANTAFEDFDPQWQEENMNAASVVVGYLDAMGGKVQLEDAAVRNSAGEAVHTAWLERNEWAHGGELDVPFGKLPMNEQDKDISQVEIAVGLFIAE